MKKYISMAVMALIALFVFTACGGSDAVEVNSIADLSQEGVRIGVQNGTTGHLHVEANFANAEILPYDQPADAVSALLAGDVDAIIMDSLPGRQFAVQNAGRIVQLEEMLTHEGYGIAFPLGSPYVALFNQALDTLIANGTMDALLAYWVDEAPGASRYVPGTYHPNGTLIMGTSAGFPPFEFFEGTQIVGLDPDIARAIGDLLGYAIEIVDMDFPSIIPAVQTGQVAFGMAGMTVTAARPEQVDFTQQYFLSGQSVLVPVRD